MTHTHAAGPDGNAPDAMTIRRAQAQSGLVPVDARVLLCHVLGVDRAWLVAHAADELTKEASTAFFALAKRRREGEPVAYLTGHREFWGLDIVVTQAVLIPRPDTETLVEAALARIAADAPAIVLDIGTGSGAVALAIARERPRARVLATDISGEALDVARTNAARLHIANAEFVLADVYPGTGPAASGADGEATQPGAPFDAIVSNPPYVAERDPHLDEGDLRYEPRAALAAGHDGLATLRRIVAGAPGRLRHGGWLVVEHGYDQSAAVVALFGKAGLAEVAVAKDLAGIPRVVAGRLAG